MERKVVQPFIKKKTAEEGLSSDFGKFILKIIASSCQEL